MHTVNMITMFHVLRTILICGLCTVYILTLSTSCAEMQKKVKEIEFSGDKSDHDDHERDDVKYESPRGARVSPARDDQGDVGEREKVEDDDGERRMEEEGEGVGNDDPPAVAPPVIDRRVYAPNEVVSRNVSY